jgi:branched-chain amino acid transport system substrate-binding protein
MRRIKLGLSISLTGDYSVQGRESFQGIKLWVSGVNHHGGIFVHEFGKKIPLELIHHDDESSVQKCRENTEHLIGEGVNILLGPYSSSLTLAAAEAAEEHGITLWNHGGSTDDIEGRGFDCVVSAISSTRKYSSGILGLVRNTDPSASKIASFCARDSGFSMNVARGLNEHALKRGFRVREFKYNSGEDDFSSLLDEAKDYEPDLIFGMGRAHDDISLAGQMIETGLKAKAIAFIAASIKLFRDTYPDESEGFISASQWESGMTAEPDTGPSPEEFTERFAAAYGVSPDYVAAQGYNIGVIIGECIKQTGSLNDKKLRETAKSLDIETFYGRFRTDGKGNQTGHEMVTVQWQKGEKVIVYPERFATGKFIYPAVFLY